MWAKIKDIPVFGVGLGSYSRCYHYNSERDIVAIKFKCCGKYYACYKCHNELEDHKIIPWDESEFSTKAVLCGICGFEMSIYEYLKSRSKCPSCSSDFNQNCKKHYSIYFGLEDYT
ncbi:MAG: CHY zinc finger protein [Spirochaetia bacterium]|nr:CHY zinc finger protein [Spirochaetota bacterium]MCX8096884.1 CHY zinc finger protein [Spirochaetota bacterium]MDW8112475.1 CHY zinc finger protein [Spirochaetia bacterium]